MERLEGHRTNTNFELEINKRGACFHRIVTLNRKWVYNFPEAVSGKLHTTYEEAIEEIDSLHEQITADAKNNGLPETATNYLTSPCYNIVALDDRQPYKKDGSNSIYRHGVDDGASHTD